MTCTNHWGWNLSCYVKTKIATQISLDMTCTNHWGQGKIWVVQEWIFVLPNKTNWTWWLVELSPQENIVLSMTKDAWKIQAIKYKICNLQVWIFVFPKGTNLILVNSRIASSRKHELSITKDALVTNLKTYLKLFNTADFTDDITWI